ncbi:uncharacterized protein N7506_005572 [Penicillium brevicompactum]|uniref:uncharacterized protein n=1 Tax=Penicillium brevicompactum TaxID=5074 RepID=UPI00254144C8|nr:uncharacterized protein N7506_005572 [Penicillium brevicompactum]KAJ5335636.1 hypothetical protein N7506_005572 [Penicillium brevicompactum]
MSDPKQYTVGWICAISTEYTAAKAFLDETHLMPEPLSPADNNAYTVGMIGKHKAVIAVLPDGEYGTASAASVARDMLHSFPNIKIGLMVGIGGGAPSPKHDIRLGDIVVSASRDGRGSVFQYDFGKAIQHQSFQQTGVLNQPPTSLRTALSALKSDYESDGHRLEESINSILEQKPRLRKKYRRPEASSDKLYRSEFVHPVDEASCAVTCGDARSHLVSRQERTDDEDNPAIHYGLIASSNQLMKDALIRDRLVVEKDVLCFEMEAAGLMNHFPCLVIRGICDYADSHKNKEWQGYAAMVAAAYAKDLLQRISLNRIDAEEKISVILSDVLKSTNQNAERAYDQRERHQDEQKIRALTEQQQRCHQVFKKSNYEEQKNVNPCRAEGTCHWALQSSEYLRWLTSSHNDLLWVSADPGCGKSVLARSIIDDQLLASSPAVTICYFFSKTMKSKTDLMKLYLFDQQPHLLPYAITSWERNGEALRNEADELWRIFIAATSSNASSQTICILDALDECRDVDQDRLIQKLQLFHRQKFAPTKETSLKFLITSRPYDRIQNGFQPTTDSFPHLHLKGEEENDQIHREIDLVVKMRVRELADTAPLSWDIQQRLEAKLLGMEHRTYLWLYLAIDDIRSTFENSLCPAEESVQMIPSSVGQAYEKILSRVPPGQESIVKKVLQIIVGARRPLTIAEMATALGLARSPQSRPAALAVVDPLRLETKLRRLCGLFVFVKNSKIYLIHQTAREFLIEKANSNDLNFSYACGLNDTENQMAVLCVQYLLAEDAEDFTGASRASESLLGYAAIHWPDHVRHMTLSSDQEMIDRVRRLYDTCEEQFSPWLSLFWQAVMPNRRAPRMNALQLAAFNGHTQQMLLEQGADINAQGRYFGNALYAACFGGYDKIAQILLEQGADVNAQGGIYGNALQAACDGGHDKITQILLERGADINAQGGHHGNALQGACLRGHNKIAYILLERGADVNAQGGELGNALQAACSGGHDKIAQMLLERGADINAQGGDYGNALQAACSGGHDKIVQILLERGADVNAQGIDYGNALYAACSGGHHTIAQMLLERGANINAQGGGYGNALHAACSGGHNKIAQMLLEQGADVNAQGGDYGNALQGACLRGHDKIAQILLERGANINAQGGGYGNALHAACSGGHNKIAQMLLEQGADVNAQGGDYGNALQGACLRGHDKIAQMLLERGANINAQGGGYGNALHAACSGGHNKIAQMLLEQGADVNAQGGDYGNALQAAYSGGHDKIVRTLLEQGANINARGRDYGNALQATYSGGHDKIAQMLLEQGADINAQGGYYGNALQAACSGGHDKIVQILLERGADVNAQGRDYRNALQAAYSGGYDKIAQMLLEQGADINAQGGYYGNALQAACSGGHDKIAQMLLEQGANINAQGGHHGNALQGACSGGHDKIAQILLERGADINAQGGHHGNALQGACSGGHDKIAQMLLEQGADINAQGGDYGNALQGACLRGHDKIAQILLERGADINAQGGGYGNALHAACSGGHHKIAHMLLERGADINAQGGDHGNALQAAHRGGYHHIVKLLQEHQYADQSTSQSSPSKRLKVSS